jgi:hypothetical protein
MWWIVGLYIIPGMVNTWLFPKFVESNGGMDAINQAIEPDVNSKTDMTLEQATALISFIPILNIFATVPLISWYICTQKS